MADVTALNFSNKKSGFIYSGIIRMKNPPFAIRKFAINYLL